MTSRLLGVVMLQLPLLVLEKPGRDCLAPPQGPFTNCPAHQHRAQSVLRSGRKLLPVQLANTFNSQLS